MSITAVKIPASFLHSSLHQAGLCAARTYWLPRKLLPLNLLSSAQVYVNIVGSIPDGLPLQCSQAFELATHATRSSFHGPCAAGGSSCSGVIQRSSRLGLGVCDPVQHEKSRKPRSDRRIRAPEPSAGASAAAYETCWLVSYSLKLLLLVAQDRPAFPNGVGLPDLSLGQSMGRASKPLCVLACCLPLERRLVLGL